MSSNILRFQCGFLYCQQAGSVYESIRHQFAWEIEISLTNNWIVCFVSDAIWRTLVLCTYYIGFGTWCKPGHRNKIAELILNTPRQYDIGVKPKISFISFIHISFAPFILSLFLSLSTFLSPTYTRTHTHARATCSILICVNCVFINHECLVGTVARDATGRNADCRYTLHTRDTHIQSRRTTAAPGDDTVPRWGS